MAKSRLVRQGPQHLVRLRGDTEGCQQTLGNLPQATAQNGKPRTWWETRKGTEPLSMVFSVFFAQSADRIYLEQAGIGGSVVPIRVKIG
jgi:hypothetical protein